MTKRFDVYVIAHAWRGTAISQAIDHYVKDLYGSQPTEIKLKNGITLNAGGAAHIVAYVGHSGWMDIPAYDWAKAETTGNSQKPKGTIAVACLTAAYLAQPITSPKRVPLLMTTSLLFAGAHSFEGAVKSFARGQSLPKIRHQAASNYSKGQGKPLRKVKGAFTNPSDKRWGSLHPLNVTILAQQGINNRCMEFDLMMTRSRRISLALLFAAIAFVAYSLWLASPWAEPLSWSLSSILAIAAISAGYGLATQTIGLRVGVAIALNACMAAFIVASSIDPSLFGANPYHDPRYATFLSVVVGCTVIGLSRRWFVARWMALGLAGCGDCQCRP